MATRPFVALGQTFYVEHGFHAWFYNYFQFKDIRDRLKINGNFKKWHTVDFVFRNFKPESVYGSGPYPFNLIGVVLRSNNLNMLDAIKSSIGNLYFFMLKIQMQTKLKILFKKGSFDLMFYEYDTAFAKYDNISFNEWARIKNIDKKFYEIMLKPALSVTVNEGETFSAAEMLMIQQIYFLSSAESDQREVTNINYYHGILKPWVDYLERKEVK